MATPTSTAPHSFRPRQATHLLSAAPLEVESKPFASEGHEIKFQSALLCKGIMSTTILNVSVPLQPSGSVGRESTLRCCVRVSSRALSPQDTGVHGDAYPRLWALLMAAGVMAPVSNSLCVYFPADM